VNRARKKTHDATDSVTTAKVWNLLTNWPQFVYYCSYSTQYEIAASYYDLGLPMERANF